MKRTTTLGLVMSPFLTSVVEHRLGGVGCEPRPGGSRPGSSRRLNLDDQAADRRHRLLFTGRCGARRPSVEHTASGDRPLPADPFRHDLGAKPSRSCEFLHRVSAQAGYVVAVHITAPDHQQRQ